MMLLALAIALGAVAASARPGAAAKADDAASPPPDARERYERWLAQRRTPAARERRAVSRRAFRDETDAEAVTLGRRTFPQLFDAPTWKPFRLRAGRSIDRYLDDQTVLIDEPGSSKDTIAVSSLPARTLENGHKVPVDLALRRRGDRFEPAHPLVGLSVPSRLGAVAVGNRGFSVRPSGAAVDSQPGGSDDQVLFPNALTDTDTIVAARPGGAEVLWQLRSDQSPERFALGLDLAAGDEIEPLPDRPAAFAVRRDGQKIAEVAAPNAYDAGGAPVPVTTKLEGNQLVYHVDHRGGDYEMPIMLDPLVSADGTAGERDEFNPFGTAGSSGWWNYTYPDQPAAVFDFWRNSRLGVGTFPTTDYTTGWWGEWRYASGGESYFASEQTRQAFLYRVDFWDFAHASTGSGVTMAFYAPGVGFEPQQTFWGWADHRDPPSSGLRYIWYGVSGWFGTHCTSPSCSPTAGTEGNYALFKLDIGTPGGTNQYETASFGGATAYINDRNNPVIDTFTNTPPAGWVDTGTRSLAVKAHDAGLGMKRMDVVETNASGSDGTLLATNAFASTCEGDRITRCPASSGDYTITYDLARMGEGVRKATFYAADVLKHRTQQLPGGAATQWNVKVDHSTPTAPVLSGSLWDHRNQATDHRNEGLNDPVYTLNASSGDTYSGLKSIDVQVDTGTPYHFVPACSGTDGCSGSIPPWTFNSDAYSDGDHTITVTAKDQLADQPGIVNSRHTSTSSFTVTVDRRGDIYRALEYEGDPAVADTVGDEGAQINTQNMRHTTPNSILTRNLVPCLSDVQGCAQERERTRASETDATATDDYTVTTGTSHDDPRMLDDSELLAPANSSLGAPSGSGPINDALQLWQRPPPAHGTTYSLYTVTDPTVTDGQPEDVVHKLWIDSATKMPLHEQTTSGGVVESEVFYLYYRARLTTAEVPADYFSVGAPARIGQTQTLALPLVDPPEPTDPPALTEAEQIAEGQAFRADYGLRNDFDYVKSVVTDPTREASIDEWGVPLTAAELTELAGRVTADDQLSVVDDFGAGQAAASYAGLYIDQKDGGKIYVGFTQNVTANMNAIKAIYPQPQLLYPFPVAPTRTVAQLDALQDRVSNDWTAGTLAADLINTLGKDEKVNKVIAYSATPTPAAETDLRTRYGDGVELREGNFANMADTATNHHTPPNIGGLYIRSDTGCTSGFGAVKKYTTATGVHGREYFDITAGHCLTSTDEPGNSSRGHGQRWRHHGKHYGTTRNDTLVPAGRRVGSDAMSLRVRAGTRSNRIFLRDDGRAHLRRITGSTDRFHPGTPKICHSGYATGHQACGDVIATELEHFEGNGTHTVHIIEVALHKHSGRCGAAPGDSGGPVYHGSKAAGILKGGFRLGGSDCSGSTADAFTFTRIGFSAADLGGLELLR